MGRWGTVLAASRVVRVFRVFRERLVVDLAGASPNG